MNLKLELAATIDVGKHFVKATYFLEGDGPLVFSCYEKLSAVSQFCQTPCFPNVRAIATAIAEEDPCQNVTEHLNGVRRLVLNSLDSLTLNDVVVS